MTPPIHPEIASLTAVKVIGAVSSDEIAKMSQQLYYLTQWANFLDTIDWSHCEAETGTRDCCTPEAATMAMSATVRRWLALAGSFCLSSCQDSTAGSMVRSLVADPPLAARSERTSMNDDDAIALSPSNVPGVVVVGGKGRNTCLRNKVFRGSGTIDLDDRIEAKASCPSEVAAFSRSRGVELNVAPAWSHSVTNPLPVTMKPPVSVPIRLYVPSVWPDAQKAEVELNLARTLAAQNRAGLVFAAPSSVPYSSAEATIIGTGCGGVANLTLNGPPDSLYDPNVINVYYIYAIDGSSAIMGYNCHVVPLPTAATTGSVADNVIFISIWYRAVTTLTHELAHSLGMRGEVAHANGLDGFTTKNLLMSGLDLNTTAAQDHLSLGQVYRMSLDELSWLNHTRPNGTAAIRSGTSRACQNSPLRATNEPCPELVLDP